MGEKGKRTREIICKAAYELFAEKGFKEVTMKDICERTGLSRGGLYRHYTSTEEIFEQIIGVLMTAQEDEVADSIEKKLPARAILQDILNRYCEEMKDREHSLSVAIYEFYSMKERQEKDKTILQQYLYSKKTWKSLIEYGIGTGEFKDADADAVFDLIVFAYQGVRMCGGLMEIPAEIPEHIVGMIQRILLGENVEYPILNRGKSMQKKAVFSPYDTMEAVKGFPEICVTTFSKNIIDRFASKPGTEKIGVLYTANGAISIYKTDYKGKQIAFYLSPVGAPACVAELEEAAAMGVKKVVMFGSCGILSKEAEGKIVIPAEAVRDEGTSYHYAEAGEKAVLSENGAMAAAFVMKKYQIPYLLGKTWTTDGIYRETPEVVSMRKREGCLTVEMEAAAVMAAARFRGIELAYFLYGADRLFDETWEIRDLCDYGASNADKLMTLAMECGLRL